MDAIPRPAHRPDVIMAVQAAASFCTPSFPTKALNTEELQSIIALQRAKAGPRERVC
jgi:hypothetical protein